jgi:uncharacterized protein
VKILPPKSIYISDSLVPNPKNDEFISGKGVFASVYIKRGEVVETAPILILDFNDFIDSKWNLLFEYYFWMDDFVVLCLGYGSLYNHSKDANCDYKIDKDQRIITFRAIKDIKKDDEILFNYSGSSSSKAPLWFER